jgi:transposase-like protein
VQRPRPHSLALEPNEQRTSADCRAALARRVRDDDRGRTMPDHDARPRRTRVSQKAPPCPTCTATAGHPPRAAAGTVTRYGFVRSSRRRQQRWRCARCTTTFTRDTGTLFERLRSPSTAVERALALSIEGVSKAAIARVVGVAACTVTRWIERAAGMATDFHGQRVEGVRTHEVQADELRGHTTGRAHVTWVHVAIAVESRLWLSLFVGPRSLKSLKCHYGEIQSRLDFGPGPVLVSTDGYVKNLAAIARTFGPCGIHASVVRRIEDRRVVASVTTIDHGDASAAQSIIDASRNSHVFNISFVDRLHGTIRRSIAALHRRSNALCRSPRTLQHQLELMRTVYNFVRPHQSLREGRSRRTPAMAAGLASRPLTLREVLRHVIRPLSGRNVQAYV